MFPNLRNREPSNLRTGFTLIEVLVATTVMAIMVLMLGGVFQQASSSWDSGYARAEGGMAVRAVVGSLTRDLATMVDGRRYGLTSIIEGNGTSLTFWRLGDGADGGVEKITYKGGGSVTRNGDTIYSPDENSSTVVSFSFHIAESDPPLRSYESKYYTPSGAQRTSAFPENAQWTVPYVKVRCAMTRTGNVSGLTVRSYGKDGVESGDDIVVR